MKKYLLVLLFLTACGGSDTIRKYPVSNPPIYQKPDLSKCQDEFDLKVIFDTTGVKFKIFGFNIYQGTISYKPDVETKIYGHQKAFVFKSMSRGDTYFVRAEAFGGGNELVSSMESSLKVLTCEELKKKVDAGELVYDTKEVTVKWVN